MPLHRLYGTEIDVEFDNTWRAKWMVVSGAGWIKGDTVPEILAIHKDRFHPFEPIILARYETCSVEDAHGIYIRFAIPMLDEEDAPITRNLQYVAVRNAKDYDQALPDGKITNECFDIKEFMP